ncbi:MAG: hypothetical protein KAI40_05230 [Desulfobacterales bacterium]|nr:hypothetical protein [Desulfobacterales bacterium]
MNMCNKVSKKELSKGNKTSDFGPCELYVLGQAGVFLSAELTMYYSQTVIKGV